MYNFESKSCKIMAEHNDLGAWGEDIAMEYMVQLGYAIVERNFRVGKYELDIIATKDDTIAFVEVKTRIDDFIDPVDAITEQKMKNMSRAAESYLRTRDIIANPQMDVITVVGSPESSYELKHYPDAFPPILSTYR